MKTKALAACLVFIAFLVAGCATPGATSATQKFPLFADNSQSSQRNEALARLTLTAAESYVIRNQVAKKPGRADGYLKIADAISAVRAVATGAEISEAAIRSFVARHADLLAPGDDELVVGLLMEARNVFLSSTGEARVLLGDQRLDAWLDAIARGIRSGVAAGLAAQPSGTP